MDPDELGLQEAGRDGFRDPLAAYRNGSLLAALSTLPEPGPPASDATRTLRGALLLAAGRVDQTEAEIKNLPSNSRLGSPLREIIAAVKHQPLPSTINHQPSTSSEWLARSYYL